MSKKHKRCKRMHMGSGFTAAVIVTTIALCVTASLLHMDALERIQDAENRLAEIETMQKHIRTYLSGASTMGRAE